ncbi:MAG: hypothetical protein II241_00730 [Clostridia bacterium]|nr:hypothetical protein [Clostridia bacterium]
MRKILTQIIAVLLVITTVSSFSSCAVVEWLFQEEKKESGAPIAFADPDYGQIESVDLTDDSSAFVGQVSPSSENEENSRFKKVSDYAVLIKKWDMFYGFGNCCDSKHTDEYVGGYNDDYLGYANYRITCCSSYAEVKQHAYHYMAEDLYEEWDCIEYFKYKGNLYFCVPAYGPSYHDVNKIEVLDDSNPSAVKIKAYEYDIDVKIGYTVFTVDTTGSYKIIDVENTYYYD